MKYQTSSYIIYHTAYNILYRPYNSNIVYHILHISYHILRISTAYTILSKYRIIVYHILRISSHIYIYIYNIIMNMTYSDNGDVSNQDSPRHFGTLLSLAPEIEIHMGNARAMPGSSGSGYMYHKYM